MMHILTVKRIDLKYTGIDMGVVRVFIDSDSNKISCPLKHYYHSEFNARISCSPDCRWVENKIDRVFCCRDDIRIGTIGKQQ